MMVANAGAALAQSPRRKFDVPAGNAARTIPIFAKQAYIQIVAKGTSLKSRRTNAVRGDLPIDEALRQLLAGSGLSILAEASRNGIVAIGTDPTGREWQTAKATDDANDGAIPDILVTGTRGWSLNTDIRRTRNDTQPYQVFTEEQIKRSGATNLDQFLRDNLSSNGAVSTSDQQVTGSRLGNVNLRGIGTGETLVLVDGRRLAAPTFGGNFAQPNINGIPLSAIDRIEVLASSASGIYGGNATGGVVNIILKRDYRGFDATAAVASSFAGGGANVRLDLSGGFNIEGGRTNIMLSGSYQHQDVLRIGQRLDLVRRAADRAVAGDPTFFTGLATPPVGATPNIRSATGANLTLDPMYGGRSLGSAITYSPYGYRGAATDGVAALIANAGAYNLESADSAQLGTRGRSGLRFPLINGADTYATNIAIRRTMNDWLKVFTEGSFSDRRNVLLGSGAPTTIRLAANAPNNPFQQAITVALPAVGADAERYTSNRDIRLVAGAIVQLPYEWQASADYSWSRNRSTDFGPFPLNPATVTALTPTAATNPVIYDVLADPAVRPVDYQFAPVASSTRTNATNSTAALRLAGPAPLALPGGKPTVTLLAQLNPQRASDEISVTSGTTLSSLRFAPARRLDTGSIYGETRLPILVAANGVPFARSLELQFAGRYEWFKGVGGESVASCFQVSRPFTPEELNRPCPEPGTTPVSAVIRGKSFNPTVSGRWEPTRGVMLRGSYATGYRVPSLADLNPITGQVPLNNLTDPRRGNEIIGDPIIPGFYFVQTRFGGNPNLRPERSRSYGAGVVLTPSFANGLRMSADWTKVVKRDNVIAPIGFVLGSGSTVQQDFNDFLAAFPERFPRAAPSDGFAVGRITSVDLSAVNYGGLIVQAVDFAADYDTKLGNGRLSFSSTATYTYDSRLRILETAPFNQNAGIAVQIAGGAGVKWRGTAEMRYTTDTWGVGMRARYFDGYFINRQRAFDASYGSAKIPAQAYVDIFANYRLFANTNLSGGVTNVLDKRPPFDAFSIYSQYGDPRLANFYLNISQHF